MFSLLSRVARVDTPGRVFDKSDTQLESYNSTQSFSVRRGSRHGEEPRLPVTEDDAHGDAWTPPNKVNLPLLVHTFPS